MGINLDLHKIPNTKLFAVILFIGASLLAPLWFLFQFNRPLFEKMDLFRLLLLSECIGFPLVFLNFIVLILFSKFDDKDDDYFYICIMYSSFLTGLIFYVPCQRTLFQSVSLQSATRSSTILQLFILFYYGSRHIITNMILKPKSSNSSNTPAPPADPLPPSPHPETQNDI